MWKAGPIAWFLKWAEGLRFPTLAFLMAAIFVADLFIPDIVPLVDEILLGLATVAIGSLRKSKTEPDSEEPAHEDS